MAQYQFIIITHLSNTQNKFLNKIFYLKKHIHEHKLIKIFICFFLLFRTTASKVSYHFIHANPTVLFQNTTTLGHYIRTIFQILLLAVAKHKCSYFNTNFGLNIISIANILLFLSPHVSVLRSSCSNCWLINEIINVPDVANLIVYNKKKNWSLSVDLFVYSKNQQFRLYDSKKAGSNNSLHTTSDYPFEEIKSHSYFDILRKSIITNVNNIQVPLIVLKNDNLFITELTSQLNISKIEVDNIILKTVNNDHLQIIKHENLNFSKTYKKEIDNQSNSQNKIIQTRSDTIFNTYIPFVNKIITTDHEHIGKIHSCVQGNRNNNKLFFNISGNYRFCPKIRTHHKRNSTSLIIDISSNNYAIRCKDPQCDNTYLTWYKIEMQ